MLAHIIFEWLLFTRNIKNRLVFLIFIIASIYYGLAVAPDYQPLYAFSDEEAISERIEEHQYILDTYSDRPLTAESAHRIIEYSTVQLEALREENWMSYFEANQMVLNEISQSRYGESIDPRFFDIDQHYPEQEAGFWRGYTNTRYYGYAEYYNGTVTPSLVEERTALQTIQRLLQDNLPFILLIMLVLFSVDSLTRDREHQTIFNGRPLSFGKILWVKTLVILVGFFLTVLAGAAGLVLTIGPRFGVGSFDIPVLAFEFSLYGGYFNPLSLGTWLLQAAELLALSSLIIVRLIMWFSILIKQELFNLVAGVALLFSESLYYSRGIGYFSDIGLLPPTFFSIGSVLMGYHNFLYNAVEITYESGLVSLGLAFLVIECIIFITTRFRLFRNA